MGINPVEIRQKRMIYHVFYDWTLFIDGFDDHF